MRDYDLSWNDVVIIVKIRINLRMNVVVIVFYKDSSIFFVWNIWKWRVKLL